MPTPSTRLGLLKPTTADPFVTADLAANWQKIDDNPGVYICLSTTRPAWGAAQQGMLIFEKDTGLIWNWDGAAFQRNAPRGLLKTTGGAWARGQRTTDFSTTSTTAVVVTSISNVVVPAGLRTLMIVVTFPKGQNTVGQFGGYIYRSNVSNQAPLLAGWYIAGDSTSPVAGAGGQGNSYICFEAGGLPPGTYNWSFQIKSLAGGTSSVSGNTSTPCEIAIIEI